MNSWLISVVFVLQISVFACQIMCFDRCRQPCKNCTKDFTFECDDGNCVDISQFRNSVKDCPDGSAEMCCDNEYQCDTRGVSKNCVHSALVNDGKSNCADKSDETSEIDKICTELSEKGEVYKCKTHRMGPAEAHCIVKDQLLNGVEDCPLGDDENPGELNECELKIAKCNEAAICINVEDGAYACVCPENFTGDGVETCLQIESNIDKETTINDANVETSTITPEINDADVESTKITPEITN